MSRPHRAVPMAIATITLLLLSNASAQSLASLDPSVLSTTSAAWAPPHAAPLDLAEQALASRASLIDPVSLAQEQANLATAGDLLTILDQQPDSLARSVLLAQEATRAQARTLGLPWVEPSLPTHATPAMAAHALIARYGIEPTAEQEHDLATLDTLPEPTRAALTRVIDAFLAFDAATQQAYAGADAAKLQALLQEAENPGVATLLPGGPGDALADAGVDLAPVFPARNRFLEAAAGLHDALAAAPEAPRLSTIQVPPALAFDLAGVNNVYTSDVALSVDIGGDDVYLNNAGGSAALNVRSPLFGSPGAAALIDLAGVDRYVSGRDYGINGGGGDIGVGFLLDAAGNDAYTAGDVATNGGGSNFGVGFLLDAAGNDAYTAGRQGTNGGGGNVGVGFLLDASGDDAYTAAAVGTNGGSTDGVGFLLDAAGNDAYTAGRQGTNGGGAFDGVGFLLDAAGNDTYTATTYIEGRGGTNGGGYFAGVGFLLDAVGNDTYTAADRGTNGGGSLGGVGFLLDAAGGDTYTAGRDGTNGGASGDSFCVHIRDVVPDCVPVFVPVAVGLLLDAGGQDMYLDASTDCTDCTVAPKGLVGAQIDTN